MAAAQFMEWNGTALVPLTAREVGVMAEASRNKVPNPSAAVNVTGYAVNAGTGGVGSLTRNAGAGWSGNGFARYTWSTGTSAVSGFFEYTMPATLKELQEYTFACYVRPSRTQLMSTRVQFRAGNPVVATIVGPSVSCPANQWTRLVVNGISPAGTTGARVDADVLTGGGVLWVAGDTLDWDALLLKEGPDVEGYYDGSFANTAQNEYSWAGTAHASESIKKAIEFKAITPVIV